MTSLSKLDRSQLASKFQIGLGSIAEHQISNDGTQKWLFELDNDRKTTQVETVFIPKPSAAATNDSSSDEGTICVSSQVGCALACKFCHTGTQKFKRNLSSGEILAQIIQVMRSVGDLPRNPSLPRNVTNIVFMV
jgi:23S rRNA (adenine2503-C2)-methyltransferase